MKQKTAIRHLIDFIDKEQGMFKDSFVLEIKNKAKELEPVNEQHIKDAYNSGFTDSVEMIDTDANEYFNQTFEKL